MAKYTVKSQLVLVPYKLSESGDVLDPAASESRQLKDEYGRPVFGRYIAERGDTIGTDESERSDVTILTHDKTGLKRYLKLGAIDNLDEATGDSPTATTVPKRGRKPAGKPKPDYANEK